MATTKIVDRQLPDNVPLLDVANQFTEDLTTSGKNLSAYGDFAGEQVNVYAQNDATDGRAALQALSDTSLVEAKAYGSTHATRTNEIWIEATDEDSLNINPSTSGVVKIHGASFKLPDYGAGVLTSDGSGNITSVPGGGGGISESLAIAYAVALG